MGWVASPRPVPFTPRIKEIGLLAQEAGWAHRFALHGCWKRRPPPEFDPRLNQPVASGYLSYLVLGEKCEMNTKWDNGSLFTNKGL
jgi:hypothetical protein